jgi:hypothetical protein
MICCRGRRIINIYSFGFEPAYFTEVFNNFLSVFNLIYSAVAELGGPPGVPYQLVKNNVKRYFLHNARGEPVIVAIFCSAYETR